MRRAQMERTVRKLNRYLEREGLCCERAKSFFTAVDFGIHYVLDIKRNLVIAKDIDPVEWLRRRAKGTKAAACLNPNDEAVA